MAGCSGRFSCSFCLLQQMFITLCRLTGAISSTLRLTETGQTVNRQKCCVYFGIFKGLFLPTDMVHLNLLLLLMKSPLFGVAVVPLVPERDDRFKQLFIGNSAPKQLF